MSPLKKRTLVERVEMSAMCQKQTLCAAVMNVHRVAGGHQVAPAAQSARAHVCRRRLTNSFSLKDRCSLSDQISFILASCWRAFILAMRDRDRANKNEIEIFVFSVTSNDFPHDMLLLIFSLKIGAAIRCQGISGRS